MTFQIRPKEYDVDQAGVRKEGQLLITVSASKSTGIIKSFVILFTSPTHFLVGNTEANLHEPNYVEERHVRSALNHTFNNAYGLRFKNGFNDVVEILNKGGLDFTYAYDFMDCAWHVGNCLDDYQTYIQRQDSKTKQESTKVLIVVLEYLVQRIKVVNLSTLAN